MLGNIRWPQRDRNHSERVKANRVDSTIKLRVYLAAIYQNCQIGFLILSAPFFNVRQTELTQQGRVLLTRSLHCRDRFPCNARNLTQRLPYVVFFFLPPKTTIASGEYESIASRVSTLQDRVKNDAP